MVSLAIPVMLGKLLEKQAGKPIQRPATGKAGTIIGDDLQPQTHLERQYSSQPVYEQAGDVVGGSTPHTPVRQVQSPQSSLVEVPEQRLIRDVAHQWPESRRGQLPESQVMVDLLRMLMIGHEQGLTPATSPMMKQALDYIDNLKMTDAELANYARNANLIPSTSEGAAVTSELGSLHRRGALSLSDEGGPLATYQRNLEAGEIPKHGYTTSSSNIYEVLLRRLVEDGVPPERVRDVAYDVLSQGSPEIAARGQASFEAGIRNMLKQKKDFPYEEELRQSGQLLGAGRSGGSGPSEMNMLRMILGQPVAKGTREATAETAALRGGPVGEEIGAGIFYGTPEAMRPQAGTAFTDKLRRGAVQSRQADVAGARGAEPNVPPKATDKGGRFEQQATVEDKGPLRGVQYAEDPAAVPVTSRGVRGISGPEESQLPAAVEQALKHRKPPTRPITKQQQEELGMPVRKLESGEASEIRPSEIVGRDRNTFDQKLQRGDTMDLEGNIGRAERQTQQMFDLKKRVDDQLDDLLKTTRGMEKTPEAHPSMAFEPKAPLPRKPGETNAQYNKRLAATGTFTFRDKIEQTKKALAAAYEKQDFEKVVDISHRVDEGNLADVALSPAMAEKAFKQVVKREARPQPPTKQATSDKMDRLKGERLLKDSGVKPKFFTNKYTNERMISVEGKAVTLGEIKGILSELRVKFKNAKSPAERSYYAKRGKEYSRALDLIEESGGGAPAPTKKIQYASKPSKTLSKESEQEAVALERINRQLAELKLQWKEAKNPVAKKMIEAKAAQLNSMKESLDPGPGAFPDWTEAVKRGTIDLG
jgi:hypothetical protein